MISRLRSSARLLAVAGLMLAWMGATNHCALARWTSPREAVHACCHGEKGKPAGQTAPACCKALQSTPAPHRLQAPVAGLAVESALLPLPERSGPFERGSARQQIVHRPPRALSFAEVILQQSLLSHGPPCAV